MTTNPTPARYRNRAEEIEAVQWTGDNAEQLRAFCGPDFDEIDPEDRAEDPDQTAAVRTHPHGGWLGLEPGDWVLKYPDHFTATSDEAFRAVWEAVAEPVPAGRDALRDRIAEALVTTSRAEWPYTPGQEKWDHHKHGDRPGHNYAISCALCTNDVDRLADVLAAVLPPPADRAAEEAYRLTLSTALGLGTGANWEAIRDRAEDLVAEVGQLTEASRRLLEQRQEMAAERFTWQERGDRAETRVRQLEAAASADRAAVLREAADAVAADAEVHIRYGSAKDYADRHEALLRRMADEAQQQTGSGSLELPGPKFKENAESLNGAAVLDEAARTIAADAALRETEGEYALAEYGYELARLIRPKEQPAVVAAVADETPDGGTRKACRCPHPTDEHSMYGCAEGCGCEWMPKRKPMDPVHILGIKPDEAPPAETQAEDPARIDRLRPEFTEHSSVEAIDAQLRRARSQERRWHIRVEWLISLRAARVKQQELGEWPAGGAQQPSEVAGDRIVAYRSALPGAFSVYCTNHADELGDGVMPLTSDDLPDGGVCVRCGVDALIPSAASQPGKGA